jgi:hypothetical protein
VRKIGIIVLAVVMALGALGAAYAYVDESITVRGFAQAGTIDADFAGGQSGNVLSTTWGFDQTYAYSIPNGDTNYLDIYIVNAYSGVQVNAIPFTVLNVGTVPLKVIGFGTPDWQGYSGGVITATAPSGSIGVGANGSGVVNIKLPSDLNNYLVEGGTNLVVTVPLIYNAAP